MHKEIYDFAVVHNLVPVKNRKSSRIVAYVVLDSDGTYHGLDVLDSKLIKSKLIPDFGTFSRTDKQSNPVVEKAGCIFDKTSKKHSSYLKTVSSGAEYCDSFKAVNAFLSKFETDDDFYNRVIIDFSSSKIDQKDVISYQIDGQYIEDLSDWNDWLIERMRIFESSKKQTGMIISSVTGTLQKACPSSGGPAIENVKNKGAFGLGRAAYIASAKYPSYQSYGFKGADCFQMGIDDANAIKAGFEYLLNHDEFYDSNFRCVFFYDKEVENIIKESLYNKSNPDDINEDDLNELEEDVTAHKSLLHDILQAAKTGVQPRLVEDNAHYYLLGINANTPGRYYLSNETYGKYNDLIQNLYQWYSDTCIFTGNKTVSIMKFYNILFNYISIANDKDAKYKDKCKKVNEELYSVPTMLLNSIYQNKQLPQMLYRLALDHINADITVDEDDYKGIKVIHAQIIKCYLIRKGYHIMAEVMDHVNVAYDCGKLFAVYEQMQWKYNHSNGRDKDLNRSLSSSYFTLAMTRPGMAFVQLADLGNAYLNGMDNKSSVYFMGLIGQLQSEIGAAFPSVFNMDERGSFVLGYYQQRAAFMKSAKEHNAENLEDLEDNTVEEKEN